MQKYAANSWIAFAALALAIALCYGNALQNSFVFDDYDLVVENPQIRSLENVSTILGFEEKQRRYRPVRFISYAVDHAVFGLDSRGFHLSNLLYHLACAFLVYLVTARLTGASRVGLLAALLFALHPVNTDAVTYIAGRRDLLSTLFYLLGFLAYLRYRDGGRAAWLGLLFAAFVLGLFSKEMAVTLPAMLLVYEFSIRSRREIHVRHLLLFGGLFLLVALFLFEKVVTDNPSTREDLYGANWLLHGLTVARVFATYLKLLCFPVTLNADYSYNTFPVTESAFDVVAWAAVTLNVALLAVAFRMWRAHKLFTFGVLWFFVALIPVAQIVPHHELMAEHYLYLPSVGFALVVALSLDAWLTSGRAQPVAYAAVGVLLVLLGTRTAMRNLDWRDDITLWEASVQTAPENARAQQNLATAYAQRGQVKLAAQHFQLSLAITPDNPDVIYKLGLAHHGQGEHAAALAQYRKAIDLRPDHGPAYFGVGQIHGLENRLGAALQAFATAARLRPRHARSQHELGTVYYKLGRIREARAQYLRTLEVDADYLAGYRNLAIVESMLGHTTAAEAAYQALVLRTPGNLERHRDLATRVQNVAGTALEDRSTDVQR